jgi:hypothetical protein
MGVSSLSVFPVDLFILGGIRKKAANVASAFDTVTLSKTLTTELGYLSNLSTDLHSQKYIFSTKW